MACRRVEVEITVRKSRARWKLSISDQGASSIGYQVEGTRKLKVDSDHWGFLRFLTTTSARMCQPWSDVVALSPNVA